jgi:rhamnose utilization protein RhaD (predicted bifunctional aldolase and dehydrogenase)
LANTFDFTELIAISRFAGERLDLVQAGGGNSSAKLADGRLYVKASGAQLGDVKNAEDFCCLNWTTLLDFVNKADSAKGRALEKQARELVQSASLGGAARPSIETLIHCILGPLTLHTHPIVVNALACRKDWKTALGALFAQALFVEYKTPGVALAMALRDAVQESRWHLGEPALAFLQNHGLIVAGGSATEVIALTNHVEMTIARHLSLDLSRYKLTNLASQLVRAATGQDCLAYYSEDAVLQAALRECAAIFEAPPTTPDQAVYCGPAILHLDLDEPEAAKNAVQSYLTRYQMLPRVLLAENNRQVHILLIGQSIRKCRELEDVLKSQVQILKCGEYSSLEYMPQEEIDYLTDWDAEKYRQSL